MAPTVDTGKQGKHVPGHENFTEGDRMLETPLGKIEIIINNNKCEYSVEELCNTNKIFSVDGRYKISVHIPDSVSSKNIIECRLITGPKREVKSYIESGERLALVSFYSNATKLSIGVEDEINGIVNNYVENGISVSVLDNGYVENIIFGIAWVEIQDEEKEDIYTWFAADPTLYKNS